MLTYLLFSVVKFPVGAGIYLSSPLRRRQLWVPPSLVSNGYQGLFHRGEAARAWSWPLTSI